MVVSELIPKELAEFASEISSDTDFNVVRDDPVVQFIVPFIATNDTTDVTYRVDRQPVSLTGLFSAPPVIVNAIPAYEPVCEEQCNDFNPCTADRCVNDSCINFRVEDGTPCGYGMLCSKGVCMLRPIRPAQQPGVVDFYIGAFVIVFAIAVAYMVYSAR